MTFQRALIDWFRSAQRPLPWRRDYEAYKVWVSEIMLQQTQVSTVIPYFDRWMLELPNIQAVAEAPQEKILKLWEGLGYYSRALNLQKAAQKIMIEHGGVFPQSYEEILALPGIGPYTAGAISSIAFQEDKPAVDGNVVRVISRLDDFREDPRKNMSYFWKRSETLLSKGEARFFNQALMELGALICTPKNPRCSDCPVQKECKAFQRDTVSLLPVKASRTSKIPIQVVIALLEKDGKVYVQKRANKGLMAGLWEFPGGKVEKGEDLESALHREILEETGLRLHTIRPFMSLQHAYTKYQVDLHCFIAEIIPGEVQLNGASEYRWVKASLLSSLPFPAANLKIIEKYLE